MLAHRRMSSSAKAAHMRDRPRQRHARRGRREPRHSASRDFSTTFVKDGTRAARLELAVTRPTALSSLAIQGSLGVTLDIRLGHRALRGPLPAVSPPIPEPLTHCGLGGAFRRCHVDLLACCRLSQNCSEEPTLDLRPTGVEPCARCSREALGLGRRRRVPRSRDGSPRAESPPECPFRVIPALDVGARAYMRGIPAGLDVCCRQASCPAPRERVGGVVRVCRARVSRTGFRGDRVICFPIFMCVEPAKPASLGSAGQESSVSGLLARSRSNGGA
jgi:hypothetical protein